MADYIGNITLVAFNFAPRGYLFCHGQTIAIASNTALFSLLGTTYGGNGTTNFALPDLRGRMAVGKGQGPGLSQIVLGERGGNENVTLLSSDIPPHSHALNVQSGPGSTSAPSGAALSQTTVDDGTPVRSYSNTAPNTTVSSTSISFVGVGGPLDIRNPYLGLNYAICVTGLFPARN